MKRRTAFTMVELLVSLALIVLIMAIMSEAFVAGLESVGHLKAIGDSQERLRVAASPLRRDVLSRHFGSDEKLSKLDTQPGEGFLRIVQAGTATPEGIDADGIPSSRATGCELHLTVRNPIFGSSRREDYFAARVPNGSPAQTLSPSAFQQPGLALGAGAEVRWFMRPVPGELAGSLPGGLQLYSLHRRQKVIHSRAAELNALTNTTHGPITGYGEMACQNVGGYPRFVTLTDLAAPANRTVLAEAAGFSPDNTALGDDLVMTDVLSFEIEVLPEGSFSFVPISAIPGCPQSSPGVWDYDTGNPALYDPLNSGKLRPEFRLRALKATMRVWDYKKNLTRQITIIEEL